MLDLDWDSTFPEAPVKLVGNLPYNIATAVLTKMIPFGHRFHSFTFMVQKEVAQRILARPGSKSYGYFTLLLQYHFSGVPGFDVPAGAFAPPPEVRSHAMQLIPRPRPPRLPCYDEIPGADPDRIPPAQEDTQEQSPECFRTLEGAPGKGLRKRWDRTPSEGGGGVFGTVCVSGTHAIVGRHMSSQLEVIPLGGLGEFGMNCAALRAGDDLILVDAGMMLPDRGAVTSLGVDLMVPDISFLLENRRQLRAIVLTHGHEDHTGGVSYIIDQLQVPVYGNRLTLGLVSSRLRERGLDKEADLRLLEPDRPVDLGAFQVEPLRMTHSFPESYCFAIPDPRGPDYLDGRISSSTRLPSMAAGATWRDSPNWAKKAFWRSFPTAPTETSRVFPLPSRPSTNRCKSCFDKPEGKIVLATFASSMHRIQIVLDLARDAGRKVVPMGRSMVSNIRLASQLGYLRTDPEVLRSRDNLARIPSDRLIVLASGSQGEPMSAMSRLAVDGVSKVRIESGDLVLLSSRIIPGNQKAIGQMINHFYRRGARVLDSRHQPIHASGHGYREDLKLMIDLTRPRYFIPIHGEFRQLAAHARLARRQGIPPDQVHLLETGEVLGLSPDKAEIMGQVPSGRRYIDGGIRRQVDQELLRDRRFLATDGVLVVGLRIDRKSWELIGEPELISRGFVRPEDSQELMREIRARIHRLVSETGANGKRDEGLLEEMLQTGLKRFLRKRTRKRPLIVPVMLTL